MASSSSSIEIIDVAQIEPSNTDSSESQTLSLTFFDLLWLKIHPVQRVIFHRVTNITRSYFDSVIVPNLKSSLSSSLSLYLPLAGKILWNSTDSKPKIVYTENDAVLFTVAESNADLSSLTGNAPFRSIELYSLLPELRVCHMSANIVSFQITLFPDQGFCIGVNAHHAVLDGKTTTMFLKTWAHICKQQQLEEEDKTVKSYLPQDLIPIFDRTVINPPIDLDTQILDTWHSFEKLFSGGEEPKNPKSLKLIPSPEITSDVYRYTHNLSREDIQTLRERLKRESESESEYSASASPSSPPSKELRLSTFVITYAYALTCVIRSRGGDPNRPVGYAFAVDCRSLLDPPIPANYFGNCVSATFNLPLTAEIFLGEGGFLAAARLVSDSVESLDEKVADSVKGLGSKGIESIFEDYLEGIKKMKWGSQFGSVAGSTRLGVYGSDFGWGRPVKTEVVSIDRNEAVSMSERRDEKGGVEMGVCLKKSEMDTFLYLFKNGLND
ncbi:unnamed protein product [Cochlearia groenlandica]